MLVKIHTVTFHENSFSCCFMRTERQTYRQTDGAIPIGAPKGCQCALNGFNQVGPFDFIRFYVFFTQSAWNEGSMGRGCLFTSSPYVIRFAHFICRTADRILIRLVTGVSGIVKRVNLLFVKIQYKAYFMWSANKNVDIF